MRLIKRITDFDIMGAPAKVINSVSRYSSRGVIVDNNQNVALMYMSELNLYKLPGGGVEDGEDSQLAFLREVREETGFQAEIIHELGYIEEHKGLNNFMQHSVCYIAKAIKFNNPITLTEDEIKLGMGVKWLPLEKALDVMNTSIQRCEDYSTKFMILRDKTILEEAVSLLDMAGLSGTSTSGTHSNLFNQSDYPILSQDVYWGTVKAKFELTSELPDEAMISNVSLIPFSGDKCVVMQINNKDWELPGGTLEPLEHWYDAISREAMEELGAKLNRFTLFGAFYCTSSSENPYRSHTPHPNFVRIVGIGDVAIMDKPSNPVDGENVTKVELVDILEAITRFEESGRRDIAELYRMANVIRKSSQIH